MSSLAAAKADNFYYPPDFDPKKHETLNKYNGQHPLRERASKLDQGILVIRFEIPFNIWCEKCGEHIAKGERFNAEKKAIGQYHSTKILQFTMSHHCGSRITIQTDPKRAEYLVVEGARKKEETYSAADAEVIELPDEEEKERRARDPLYRLEYQQDAKAKALTAAQRLAAIHDAADARAADPYSLNKAMRAALRGEKRTAAQRDAQRAALGLPDDVALLAPSDGDAVAAQVAFLTSSARAVAGAEARRKRILEEDIFGAAVGAGAAGRGTAAAPQGGDGGARLGLEAAIQRPSPLKRPLLTAAAAGPLAAKAGSDSTAVAGAPAGSMEGRPGGSSEQSADQGGAGLQQGGNTEGAASRKCKAEERAGALTRDGCAASRTANGASTAAAARPELRKESTAADATRGNGRAVSSAAGGAAAAPAASGGGGRPPPGAAALAAAAARAAALAPAPRAPAHAAAPASTATMRPPGKVGVAAAALQAGGRRPGAAGEGRPAAAASGWRSGPIRTGLRSSRSGGRALAGWASR